MAMTIGTRATRGVAIVVACASSSILMTGPAWPACTPAAGNNVTAVCTGVSGGYGGAGFSNLNVTVGTGATVSGVPGILFNTGSLTNHGLVDGGAGQAALFNMGTVVNDGTLTGTTGIDAAVAVVTNRGNITPTGIGIANGGGQLTLDNSGAISSFFAIFTGVADIANSGTISGTGGSGIDASTRLTLSNTGAISAQTAAIIAPTAVIANAGSIGSAAAAAIDVTTLSLSNSGVVSGVTSGVLGATATIANSGSIVANGGPAIDLGGNLTLTNSGLVRGNSDGINAASATIVNAGSIFGNARAVNLVGAGDIANTGSIFGGLQGIVSFSSVRLINSGTVYGSNAAMSVNVAIIDNSGSILSNSVAIDSGTSAINNSGTIAGKYIAITTTDLTLVNTGTISVSDPAASAIYALKADIGNAGLIAGANVTSPAISLGSAADTLTSFAGSRIIGRIDLGGGADRVNFRGGNFDYTFNSLAGVTVTSTTPYVVQGSRVVTVDPTPFAVTDRNLLAFSAAITSALPMTDPPPVASRQPMNFAATDPPPGAAREAFAAVMTPQGPTAFYAGGASVWARGFAGGRDQSATGALLHTVNRFQGGLLGGDWQAGPSLRLGAFAGAGAMRSTEDFNLAGTSSDVAFGGVFARGTFGDTFLDVLIQLGHVSTHGSRLVSNNLVSTGIETAAADYSGFYAIPEIALGRHITLGEIGGTAWRLIPVGRVRYLGGNPGGYSESGATAGLTVGGRLLSEIEERAELKLTGTFGSATGTLITGNLRVGVLGAQRLGDAAVNATLLGQSLPFATPGPGNIRGVLGGGGLEVNRGRAGVFVSGDYLKASDSSVVYGGRGGFRVTF
jgi:hypothetical protein